MKYQLANIGNSFHKGWLKIKFLDQSERTVPQGLIVTSTNSVDLYLISEGVYAGQKAYIEKRYLKEYIDKFQKLELNINRNKNKIYLKDFNFDVILSHTNSFSNDMLVLVPDHPHQKILPNYTNEKVGGSRFAETWFNLMNNDGHFIKTDIYFHFGKYSNGCITFPYSKQSEASRWNIFYEILIRNRVMQGVCASMKII